jgi:hypothetical protein
MVAEILTLQAFVFCVFRGREPKGGFRNFRGEDRVVALLFDSALFPLVSQLIANRILFSIQSSE